jgi:hypothetical protein
MIKSIYIFLYMGVLICNAQNKNDFLNRYDIFYFDNGNNFTKNGKIIEKGGDKFTPDILYSDGSFLSSYSEVFDKVQRGQGSVQNIIKTSTQLNQNKLFFQGHIYESYYGRESVLRDNDIIYYLKCMKLEYNKRSDGNCCVKTALYANNNKVDEADIESDILKSTGFSNIQPLFVKRGILYYAKTVGEESNFYSYEPISKKKFLYKPELFYKNNNELLGILDNGDIIFSNYSGVYKNNLQSKIVDTEQIRFSLKGICVGNDYYHEDMGHTEKGNNVGYNLFKNNLLAAKIHSDTHGEMIDGEKQACNFNNNIWGYGGLMYCINKNGTIVRMDERTKEKAIETVKPSYEETDVAYFVNNDAIDFSGYWTIGGNVEKNVENSIQSISFIFDVRGNVSCLVVNAYDKIMALNIYLVQYLGDGKIGSPELLVSNATLFGVVKK